jgi:hypothetical protein
MYLGQWDLNKDMPDGYGVLAMKENKAIYFGWLERGKRHGNGTLIFGSKGLEGDCLTATWKHGQASGKGHLEHTDGRTYKGHFKADMKEGKGKESWPNGNTYEGQYAKGQ